MDLQSLVTWNGMPPEYILDGLWYISIDNELGKSQRNKATIRVGDMGVGASSDGYSRIDKYARDTRPKIIPQDFLDPYIEEVTIPQMSLKYEKTDFDMINFEDKENFDDITLTFKDDIYGTCLDFFYRWTNSIFDIDNNCLKSNWRNESMILTARLVRILRKNSDPVTEFARSSINNLTSTAEGLANLGGFSLKDKLKDIEVVDCAVFEMRGCYPQGIQSINLVSDDGGVKTFSVEIVCETVKDFYRANDFLDTDKTKYGGIIGSYKSS